MKMYPPAIYQLTRKEKKKVLANSEIICCTISIRNEHLAPSWGVEAGGWVGLNGTTVKGESKASSIHIVSVVEEDYLLTGPMLFGTPATERESERGRAKQTEREREQLQLCNHTSFTTMHTQQFVIHIMTYNKLWNRVHAKLPFEIKPASELSRKEKRKKKEDFLTDGCKWRAKCAAKSVLDHRVDGLLIDYVVLLH